MQATTYLGISLERQQVFLNSNLSVSFGTNGEKGSGLGLLLTKEFLRANNGRFGWKAWKRKKLHSFLFSER